MSIKASCKRFTWNLSLYKDDKHLLSLISVKVSTNIPNHNLLIVKYASYQDNYLSTALTLKKDANFARLDLIDGLGNLVETWSYYDCTITDIYKANGSITLESTSVKYKSYYTTEQNDVTIVEEE